MALLKTTAIEKEVKAFVDFYEPKWNAITKLETRLTELETAYKQAFEEMDVDKIVELGAKIPATRGVIKRMRAEFEDDLEYKKYFTSIFKEMKATRPQLEQKQREREKKARELDSQADKLRLENEMEVVNANNELRKCLKPIDEVGFMDGIGANEWDNGYFHLKSKVSGTHKSHSASRGEVARQLYDEETAVVNQAVSRHRIEIDKLKKEVGEEKHKNEWLNKALKDSEKKRRELEGAKGNE